MGSAYSGIKIEGKREGRIGCGEENRLARENGIGIGWKEGGEKKSELVDGGSGKQVRVRGRMNISLERMEGMEGWG